MEWKRPLFIGIGWGLGTAVGLVILVGGFLWYLNRPKPPKPWNTSALRAEYDDVSTEGDKNYIIFRYTLENPTDFDYHLEDGSTILMSVRLKRENVLTPASEVATIDFPVFVPAKKRIRFVIYTPYAYPIKEKADSSGDERKKYSDEVEKYVQTKMTNLDGFDLLDKSNRYEVIFPAGWSH